MAKMPWSRSWVGVVNAFCVVVSDRTGETNAEELPTIADVLPTIADELPTIADELPTTGGGAGGRTPGMTDEAEN